MKRTEELGQNRLYLECMGLNRLLRRSGGGGLCPFASGFGEMPPYFAGRDTEQRTAVKCLDAMRAGGPFQRCLVLWGPRGNGKTAMLEWTAREARERGVQVLKYAAAALETKEQLMNRVAGRPRWTERVAEISWSGLRWKPRTQVEDALEDILVRRLRKAPLALLIDEAHTLDPSVGRLILNAVQELASSDGAILLVLAGTPILTDRLAEMQSTFWERSKVLPFNLLSNQDASDAIRIPFESAGRAISADALAGVVSASNGYPYFLQSWGTLLWSDVGQSAARVTESDVRRVQSDFDRERDQFYQLRLRELRRLDLLKAAVAVARAYGSAQDLHEAELAAALEPIVASEGTSRDTGSVAATISRLESVGFIWQPGCARPDCYSRGIPSLMDYVLKAASSGTSATSA